jgi:xylulokinase
VNSETVIGIDIGTASTKGIVATPDGTVLVRTQRTHSLSLPQPGWAEHDAEAIWWEEAASVCQELAAISGTGLRAVCVSGIGPSVVPCDRELRPLRPAILYGIDSRASAEIEELERLLGADAIFSRCGSALSSQALGPKLLWLRRHEPDVWTSACGWYMASSFVAARLTGAYVLDHQSASQCDPFYDLVAGTWAEDWAGELLPEVPLPELVWPADVVGHVTPEAARATGLPPGTPVAAGTTDAWAEAFSVGVRAPGDVMLMYGSTMFFVQVTRDLQPNPLLWSTCGVVPGTKTVAAGMSTSGSLTEWLRDLAGKPPWSDIVAEAAAAPPGGNGLLLLPYFAGERTPIYDPDARGVIAGLTLRHGRGDLLRAVYEGTAFAARQIVELLGGVADGEPRVVAVGGGTHSDLWLQIVSDVTGAPQAVPQETSGAAYGDALLAAIATGLVAPDTDWARIESFITPEASSRETYDELFALYASLYESTANVVHRLARLDLPAT